MAKDVVQCSRSLRHPRLSQSPRGHATATAGGHSPRPRISVGYFFGVCLPTSQVREPTPGRGRSFILAWVWVQWLSYWSLASTNAVIIGPGTPARLCPLGYRSGRGGVESSRRPPGGAALDPLAPSKDGQTPAGGPLALGQWYPILSDLLAKSCQGY